MDETTKTKRLMSDFETSILVGKGIDIGCGPDPVRPEALGFDQGQGDAADILNYVQGEFDYVYSSHCLEHMPDPRKALLDWWQLVRPGGHLFLVVPDEDLYEQGVFPSRFNSDHKATFTLSKARSWSPVSFNVLDLAQSLPEGQLISLSLQDQDYDRRLLRFGPQQPDRFTRRVLRLYRSLHKRLHLRIGMMEALAAHFSVVDQTLDAHAVAQIHCIVRKSG